GQDRGAAIPWGIPIGGEPPVQTPQTSATLSVGNPFWVTYKYRVNGGAWSAEIPVAAPIQLNGLTNGSYTVQVVGRDHAGIMLPDAQATSSKTWTVNTALSSIIINEVLANNTVMPHAGGLPDMIELYNAGAAQ